MLIATFAPLFHLMFHNGLFTVVVGGIIGTETAAEIDDEGDNQHKHHAGNEDSAVQCALFIAQRVEALLHHAVLTGSVEQVEVEVAVLVRLGFHAQGTIDHRQMLTHIDHQFGALRTLVCLGRHLNALHGIECHIGLSAIKIVVGDGDVGLCDVERRFVLLELSQGP